MCRMNGIVIAAETEANSTITASGVIECFNSIVEFIQNIGLAIGRSAWHHERLVHGVRHFVCWGCRFRLNHN